MYIEIFMEIISTATTGPRFLCVYVSMKSGIVKLTTLICDPDINGMKSSKFYMKEEKIYLLWTIGEKFDET